MLYFYPLSRCQPCNQIFLSPAKDKLPNSLSTSTSRVHAPPRLEDEFEARFSRGRAKYRRWRGGGGRGRVKPPRRALLLYTKYNRSPQLSSETSEIRFDPSTSTSSLPIEVEARRLASLVPATIPGGLCGLKPPTSAESKSSFQ